MENRKRLFYYINLTILIVFFYVQLSVLFPGHTEVYVIFGFITASSVLSVLVLELIKKKNLVKYLSLSILFVLALLMIYITQLSPQHIIYSTTFTSASDYTSASYLGEDNYINLIEIDDDNFKGIIYDYQYDRFVIQNLEGTNYLDTSDTNHYVSRGDFNVSEDVVYLDGLFYINRVTNPEESSTISAYIEVFEIDNLDLPIRTVYPPTQSYYFMYLCNDKILYKEAWDGDWYELQSDDTFDLVIEELEGVERIHYFNNNYVFEIDGIFAYYDDDFNLLSQDDVEIVANYDYVYSEVIDNELIMIYKSKLDGKQFKVFIYDTDLDLIDTFDFSTTYESSNYLPTQIYEWNDYYIITMKWDYLVTDLVSNSILTNNFEELNVYNHFDIDNENAKVLFVQDEIYIVKDLYDAQGESNTYIIEYDEYADLNPGHYDLDVFYIIISIASIPIVYLLYLLEKKSV